MAEMKLSTGNQIQGKIHGSRLVCLTAPRQIISTRSR